MSVVPTILLIDDYPDALAVWDFFLSSVGFTVLTASNGADAIALAERTPPSVIVTDLELPGMSGFEIARFFRSRPESRHVPLIAATGYSNIADSEEARTAGFDRIIVKPCPPDVLLAEIQRLLARTAGGSGNHVPLDGNGRELFAAEPRVAHSPVD